MEGNFFSSLTNFILRRWSTCPLKQGREEQNLNTKIFLVDTQVYFKEKKCQ